MPLPLEIGGWFITNHAVESYKARYGLVDKGLEDDLVRKRIAVLLNSVLPESGAIYSFISQDTGTEMELHHVRDKETGTHYYFLVNPFQRPKAVITVIGSNIFPDFWGRIPRENVIKGPEHEKGSDTHERLRDLEKRCVKLEKENAYMRRFLSCLKGVWEFLT